MATSKKVPTPATEAPTKRAAAKTTPEVASAKPAAVKKAAAPKKVAASKKPAMTVDQRNNYVQVAAFYIAERRGFALANPADDWSQAEAEIDRLIASGHFAG